MDTEFLFLALGLAALFAGFVDSIVGGSLIQLPALFAAFPSTAPAALFGTNKLASIVGTTSAAIQYSRRVEIPWRVGAWGGRCPRRVLVWGQGCGLSGSGDPAPVDPCSARPRCGRPAFLRKDLGSGLPEAGHGWGVGGDRAGRGRCDRLL